MLLFVRFLLKSVKKFSYPFRCLLFQVNLFCQETNRPALIEAKNSVPADGRLGQTEPVVQPAIFLGSVDPRVAGFVFGKGRARRGRGVIPKVAKEESQGKGPDACL
jgi:hypothetical protein